MEENTADIRDTVDFANALREEDLVWKPIHANNLRDNPVEGYYALVLRKDSDGRVHGRKYSIIYQYKEDPRYPGEGLVVPEMGVDLYLLFELRLPEVIGPLDYPAPQDMREWDYENSDGNTLCSLGINDYGDFIFAYPTMELAKKRAVKSFQGIYGYALSHLLPSEGE